MAPQASARKDAASGDKAGTSSSAAVMHSSDPPAEQATPGEKRRGDLRLGGTALREERAGSTQTGQAAASVPVALDQAGTASLGWGSSVAFVRSAPSGWAGDSALVVQPAVSVLACPDQAETASPGMSSSWARVRSAESAAERAAPGEEHRPTPGDGAVGHRSSPAGWAVDSALVVQPAISVPSSLDQAETAALSAVAIVRAADPAAEQAAPGDERMPARGD
mmetsp:Transcript_8807/g.33219  ORF Transcript_8807/g.33219 Transcript_8807/m.33219 type:complete len:222 (-) Transcript_8807:8409-9074(-)